MELTLNGTQLESDLSLANMGPLAGPNPLPHREILKLMALSREGDRREGILLRQGKGWFQVSAMGHEGLAAMSYALRPDDYIFGYYRDRAMMLARGVSNYSLALAYFAKAESSSGGRQMPGHYSDRAHNIFPVATPTASQNLPAVGAAWSFKLSGTDQVAITTLGDAASREGEFYEALAFALQEKLPVIFVIEDNRYGISTPTERMFPYRIGALGHSSMVQVNARDVDELYEKSIRAIDKARRGDGPTVLWCDVDRLCSHTSSDDQRLYRCAEDLNTDLQRDPIDLLAAKVILAGEMTLAEWHRDLEEITRQVDEDYKRAELAPDPDPSHVTKHLFGPESGPHLPNISLAEGASMVAAIDAVLQKAAEENPKAVFFGEDIEDPKGGVFGLTKGLSGNFPNRVFNAPLAEATIIGTAVGVAAAGYLPIFEIQFIDFISPALNQLMQQVATLRYRSNGDWQCPMVIMAPYGAYLPGGSLWHSESNEGIWAHIHGLNVVIPSTAADAAGLLWTAIHGNDPTLFLVPKHIFRKRSAVEGPVPALPFGKAVVRKSGWDITLVTWGNCTELAEEAIALIEAEGSVTVEMIDLRTICPCDYETVAQSLSKTGRLVVVHEDAKTTGFGQSVISEITSKPEWFNYLYSAPQLVARGDVHIPFNPVLEYAVLPTLEQVVEAMRLVMK